MTNAVYFWMTLLSGVGRLISPGSPSWMPCLRWWFQIPGAKDTKDCRTALLPQAELKAQLSATLKDLEREN